MWIPKSMTLFSRFPSSWRRTTEKWSARFEKGKPNKDQEEALAELEDEWNSESDATMYGTKPRRIGEKWEVDAAQIPGFSNAVDGVKGKVTLTLIGEKKVNGHRCAILKGKIDAVRLMKGEADDDPDTKVGLKGEVKIVRSLEHYADLRMEMKGQMKMTLDGPSPQGPMKLVASGPFEFTGSLEIKEGLAASLTRARVELIRESKAIARLSSLQGLRDSQKGVGIGARLKGRIRDEL